MELDRSKLMRRSRVESNCAEGFVRTANECMQVKTYNLQNPINDRIKKNSFAFHKRYLNCECQFHLLVILCNRTSLSERLGHVI